MSRAHFRWSHYLRFPYERRLAKRELSVIGIRLHARTSQGLTAELNGSSLDNLNRLTYFSEVLLPEGGRLVPEQARVEVTHRNGRATGPQPTRYSAHGLHEFKGKFNPQIVRAIGNLIGLDEGARVMDPFCGSGTTLLEGAHLGWDVVGLDLNPLAILISNAKVVAFHTSPKTLARSSKELLARIRADASSLDFSSAWDDLDCTRVAGSGWEERLPNFSYLVRWFPRAVLAQASFIIGEIEKAEPKKLRDVYLVILSDLLREGSQQEPADLRIRRRTVPIANHDLFSGFETAVNQHTRSIIVARGVLPHRPSRQRAITADAREVLDHPEVLGTDAFDAVVTSPPYANALPYIDTHRLSIALLGLASQRELLRLERSLTGSREIGEQRRLAIEDKIEGCPAQRLGPNVIEFCRSLLKEGRAPENGFRRRNTPALIYSYFSDMAAVFAGARHSVATGGRFALIVGPNTTKLGKRDFVVDTPRLLAEVAEHNGWEVERTETLDTFPRFDLHSRNSIRAETLVILRNGKRAP